MDYVSHATRLIDAFFIFFFRIPEDAAVGFYLGCAVVAAVTVFVGDISQALAHRINLSHFRSQTKDMVHLHNLSIKALRRGDKENYKAANKLANDTFGKAFFTRAALFTVSIWPLPFAMGWLAGRFQGVDIPLPMLEKVVGFNAIFLPVYILTRIAYSRIKPKIGFLRRLDPGLAPPPEDEEKPIPWIEVIEEGMPSKKSAGEKGGAASPTTASAQEAAEAVAPK
ncbi:MAG: hypothetical protein RDU30_07535 [Desulfovibrionaceae bacterium]|nr:hypothetical protein [Desulfovibrionaceae bacterium]